jgi:hypothetical protein
MTERLLSFYPPLDVVDPKTFIAGIVSILAQYPEELMATAVAPTGIPARIKALRSLAAIKEVCDELYEPIARRIERECIANQPLLLAKPKRTDEQQAEIDRQIAVWRAQRSQ